MADVLKSYKHRRPGYIVVMKSAEVRDHLLGRALDVRRAAEEKLPHGLDLVADTTEGRTRAGATVLGVPMRLEVAHRILGSSIDAAR